MTLKIPKWILVSFVIVGCTGVTSLSEEEPYSNMIGQCYVLQQDMKVRENGCWSLGGLILSPDDSYCFSDVVFSVAKGTDITMLDIKRRQWGSAGFCPQAVVSIDGLETSEGEVFIPLCFSNESISWLEDPFWRRGDMLKFRSEYIKSCD